MILPLDLLLTLKKALVSLGDVGEIRQVVPVSGGCINHAVRLDTQRNSYLLKWNLSQLHQMFRREAEGLRRLSDTATLRVPNVLAVADETSEDSPAFILLEFIHAPAQPPSSWEAETLGIHLAEMHRKTSSSPGQLFGLAQDNYLGSSLQPNGWCEDWIGFFRERRIRYQLGLAEKTGYLNPNRRRLLDRLVFRLPEFIGSSHIPSLIHGDLWSGNVIPDENQLPVLIDPAVYYADREAEIAYTELFGGFSPRFYQAYQDTWPLDKNYPDRRDLYNVYHLLNHLNLFGEAYGSRLDAILRYYVG